MNKAIYGYQMLMIISASDGAFQEQEEQVIKDYVEKEFGTYKELEEAEKKLKTADPEEWESYFSHCRDEFYKTSTLAQRNHFLQFAMNMAKADEEITEEENHFLTKLFNIWDPENE